MNFKYDVVYTDHNGNEKSIDGYETLAPVNNGDFLLTTNCELKVIKITHFSTGDYFPTLICEL